MNVDTSYSRLNAVFLKPPFPWQRATKISAALADEISETEEFLRTVGSISWDIRDQTVWADKHGRLSEDRSRFVSDLVRVWVSKNASGLDSFFKGHMKDLRLVEVSSVHTSGLGQIHYFPKCFLVSEIGVLCRVSKIYPSLPLLVRVVGAYVHFLFIHPFVDQNGRAARKLLTGVLSNAVADQNAEVPVGFLVSLDRPRHNNIIHEFAATGDWDGLMRYFCLLFRAAGQIRLREMRRRRDDGVRGRL